MSKLRCWPGCLARLEHGPSKGVVVRVLSYEGDVPVLGPTWEVEAPRPLPGTITDVTDGVRYGVRMVTRGCAPDRYLTPITPPPGTKVEDTHTDKPVEVPA